MSGSRVLKWESDMAKIEGGCTCGKVHYRTDAEPIFSGLCHCKTCQKLTGSSFSVVVAVPEPALTITGDLKVFDGKGDTGQGTHYSFCPNCGSPIIGVADVMPGVVMIRAGTIDSSSWPTPTMEIYCDSKMPWVALGGELQSFPKMPMPG
jgi:hypothetical protein